MITFILLVAALVCFLLATFGPWGDGGPWHRVGFGWLGLALVTITWLIAAYPGG